MIASIAAHLWQSTLVAGAAALLVLVLRRNGAAVRYSVWLAASVKFLIPFSVIAALVRGIDLRAPLAPGELFLTVEALAAPRPAAGDMLAAFLGAVWACGMVLILARRILVWGRLSAVIRAARPLALEAPIPVRGTASTLEPGIAGLFRPVLLLPAGIGKRLTPPELRAVIAHELCHWRRRDHLTAALHMLTETLFWFHPMVWWIGVRLVEERERACDESVLAAGNDAETYAESILKVCRLYLAAPLACAPGVSGADLKKRIEAIMTNPGGQPLSPAKRLLIATGAAAVILVPLAAVWMGFTDVMRAPAKRCDESGRICAPRANPARPNTGTGDIYPAESRQLREEGSLVLLLTVDESGRVSAAKVQAGSGYERLDQAARGAAFASWRFLPGTVDGTPRAMRMPIRVTFRLPPG